jgi:short-subunit dehydrogenase
MPDQSQTHPRVAVVIGAGGGIGRAIAIEFASNDYALALVDLDPSRLNDTIRELPRASEHRAYQADITSESKTNEMVQRILQDFGRIDCLIHTAGLTHVSPADQTRLDVYRRVMEVNFFGVVSTTKQFLSALLASRGQIVVLSSICGIAPLIGRTGYCASKYALHGYFESLRSELHHHGVSVLLVCPSFVDTSFATRGLAGDGQTLSFDRSTLGVPIAPSAIARAITRACRQRKRLLVFTWRGWLTYYLTRLAPSLYDRLMRRTFDVELKRSLHRDAT